MRLFNFGNSTYVCMDMCVYLKDKWILYKISLLYNFIYEKNYNFRFLILFPDTTILILFSDMTIALKAYIRRHIWSTSIDEDRVSLEAVFETKRVNFNAKSNVSKQYVNTFNTYITYTYAHTNKNVIIIHT